MNTILDEIYIRYNQSEHEPDIMTVVEDINLLLKLLGYKAKE